MQNPPPPPPPSGGAPPPPPPPYGQPAMPPGGQPPMMQPAGAIAAPGDLADPWLRIVGGLIDVVILIVINGAISAALQKATSVAGLINLIIDLGYFGYFLSQRGQTIGMMVFGFKVRDQATGQFPSVGKAVLRGFIWNLEVGLTVCLVGIVGWAWQLWDPRRQAIHDKVAGTIVTKS